MWATGISQTSQKKNDEAVISNTLKNGFANRDIFYQHKGDEHFVG